MTEQVFVDSLVAINITISLFLWSFVCLWTIRSRLTCLHRLQTLLLISTMFPAMIVISLSHASWSSGAQTLFWLEIALTVIGGPFYFDFVYGRIKSASSLHLTLPAIGFLSFWIIQIDELRFILFVPVIFTLASICLYWLEKDSAHRKLLVHVFSVAVIMHLAQLFRYLGRNLDWFEELVPFTATILGLTYMCWLLLPHKQKPDIAKDDHAWDSVFRTVDSYLQRTKAYCNPQLKVATLAEQLDLRPYLLSQAINQQAGRFNDYINRYRIEAFLDRYDSNQKVEALAHQVGFNSKSAFYRAFRNVTGKTPREYGVF